ncbi:MAG: hypothetical protein ACJ761_09200 [Chloroflexota bacterium]
MERANAFRRHPEDADFDAHTADLDELASVRQRLEGESTDASERADLIRRENEVLDRIDAWVDAFAGPE